MAGESEEPHLGGDSDGQGESLQMSRFHLKRYKWLFLDVIVIFWCYSCPANKHHAFANPQLACAFPPAVPE